MKEEPKPCPFCGSLKIMAEGQSNWVALVCQKCLAQGPKVFHDDISIDNAIDRWNTRKDHK